MDYSRQVLILLTELHLPVAAVISLSKLLEGEMERVDVLCKLSDYLWHGDWLSVFLLLPAAWKADGSFQVLHPGNGAQ